MKKEKIENILNDLLISGGDFAEVFLEDKITKNYNYLDNKLDSFKIATTYGLGLRLAKNNQVYYGATNDFSKKSLKELINLLNQNIKGKVLIQNVKLAKLKSYKDKVLITDDDSFVKNKLQYINNLIRKKDQRIKQVNINVTSIKQIVKIANHKGRYVKENRYLTRLYLIIYFEDQDLKANITYSKGAKMGLELLDTISYEKEIANLIKEGLAKLYAKPCLGKIMPVVIAGGFGGVIIHEACGHALEATSVADNLSVLANDLNKKIANPKVTIIDDGTIYQEWGSSKIDDEGNLTQKNVLIKDGVLVNYLIDTINNRQLKMQVTGSARRESYLYAPTSRMNNTYLAKGLDKVSDMIKGIDLGLYAAKMGGGCVSPETGDFNFNCDLAYMIRDGKIAECVKSASLTGNTKNILKEITMVSDNLSFESGMCGSISGYVPVNVGQPTIKVAHILVGGAHEE